MSSSYYPGQGSLSQPDYTNFANPAYARVQQYPDVFVDTAAQKAAAAAETEKVRQDICLSAKAREAQIDLAKFEYTEEIRDLHELYRAKERADTATKKAMQKTIISKRADGRIQISREMFGEEKKECTDFRISGDVIRYISTESSKEVLYIPFAVGEDEKKDFYLDLGTSTENEAMKKLDRIGVRFGFKREEERNARETLLNFAIREAKVMMIPLHHGLCKLDGEWLFAPKETVTWQEVKRFVE